jgi:hypothetical protein
VKLLRLFYGILCFLFIISPALAGPIVLKSDVGVYSAESKLEEHQSIELLLRFQSAVFMPFTAFVGIFEMR